MIIDAHSHMLHESYLDTLKTIGGAWAKKRIERTLERINLTPQYSDVSLRVRQLERHRIDLQMVTISVALDVNNFPCEAVQSLGIARALNDSLARLMEESRGKLLAAASVPIAGFDSPARKEMERAINSLGLKAVNVPTNVSGRPLDLPEFEPFWEHTQKMDIPVYLHPWPQPGRSYEQDYDLPHVLGWPFETAIALARLVFSGLLERHPGLKIVSHHLGGGMIPFFMGRIIESNDPTGLWESTGPPMPRPLYDYFSLFYYDSAVGGSAAAVKCAYEVFGADQIVFATDAPNGPGRGESRLATYPESIRSLGLPKGDTEKILSGNARRILKLA